MYKKIILSLVFLVSALSLIVKSNAEDSIPDLSTGGGKAVLHSLHNENLRRIMGRLNTLAYEREYTELELDRLRQENLKALAASVADLVKLADQLPEYFPDDQLSDEEQVTFKAMANQLQDETSQLLDSSSTSTYSSRNTAYRNLAKTCMACHNLFRDR